MTQRFTAWISLICLLSVLTAAFLPVHFLKSGPVLSWDTASASELFSTTQQAGSRYYTYDEFIEQLHVFRDTIPDYWLRALAVTVFVRSQAVIFDSPGINDTHDMRLLLRRMQFGDPVLCNDMATLDEFALNEAGIQAHRFHIATDSDRIDTHVTVDVWLPRRRDWVMIDPTFAGYYTYQGVPVSSPEIHSLLEMGDQNELEFQPLGDWTIPRPDTYVLDPRLLYGFIEQQNPIRPFVDTALTP